MKRNKSQSRGIGLYKWFESRAISIVMLVFFGCVVYMMLLSQNLVNSYDGLWHNSSYFAGDWERSIGRWFWPYLDKMRFGVVSYPVNSFFTLLLEAVTIHLLADLFAIKNKKIIFLMGALFIASPLTCDILSYSYMSPTFGVAFLLSVCAAYCITRIAHPLVAIFTGGFLIAFDMGCYQAYLGVTCVIILFFIMKKILKNAVMKEIGMYIGKSVGAIVCGGGIYKLMVTVTNYIYGVSLSDYRGINEVSIQNIVTSLPQTIPSTYKVFYRFFCTELIQNNIFGNKMVNICLFVIVVFLMLYELFQHAGKNLMGLLLVLIMLMLIPLVCNISLLIASKTGAETSILMAGGMVIVPILFLVFFYDLKVSRILYMGYVAVICVSLWVNIWIVNNDQLAMREGRIGTITITQNIISRLISEGYLGGNEEYEMAFIGRTSDNELFQKTDAWRKANDYATFGHWWTETNPNGQSWRGLVREYCGISMRICGDEVFNRVLSTGEVDTMSVFPHEGCIQVINDVVVIKVSNVN